MVVNILIFKSHKSTVKEDVYAGLFSYFKMYRTLRLNTVDYDKILYSEG